MRTVRLPGLVWILALWLSGGASLAWPQAAFAQKKHPEELKGAKSAPSETLATLRFVNRSPQTVSIYWLDFNG